VSVSGQSGWVSRYSLTRHIGCRQRRSVQLLFPSNAYLLGGDQRICTKEGVTNKDYAGSAHRGGSRPYKRQPHRACRHCAGKMQGTLHVCGEHPWGIQSLPRLARLARPPRCLAQASRTCGSKAASLSSEICTGMLGLCIERLWRVYAGSMRGYVGNMP
jgi:hypothetical protein